MLLWVGFLTLVVVMLAADLGLFSRVAKERTLAESALWTIATMILAVAFSVCVYWIYENKIPTGFNQLDISGREAALQYLTGWLVEQSLSLDNVMVIAIIFQHFAVPTKYQHRVLFWGIGGALVMRAVFIAVGAALIQSFDWIFYIFGALLVYAGVKIFKLEEVEIDPSRNVVVRLARRFLPVTSDFHGQSFVVRENGRRMITPLFLALLVVETTDLLFAIDSIPAVFAITSDPFLVFTSNVFAILCLRSLYFVLAALVGMFRYLKASLALMLIFIGVKMLIHSWIHISTGWSLAVIATALCVGIGASLVVRKPAQLKKRVAPGSPL